MSGLGGGGTSPPECTSLPAAVRQRFPKVRFDAGDRFTGSLCQIADFAGGVAVGDADGDSIDDLVISNVAGEGRLMRNDGRGTFNDVTAAAALSSQLTNSVGVTWVDVDGDRDNDLFVTYFAATRNKLFMNDGRGRFREDAVRRGVAANDGTVHMGFSTTVGDYDRDGYADLFVSEYTGLARSADLASLARSTLFHNRGAREPGVFDDVTKAAGLGEGSPLFPTYAFAASFRDLNRDGFVDLVVTGDFGTSRLFWNEGGRRFRDDAGASGLGTEENGMGATAADIDFDGDDDRFVSSIRETRGDEIARDGNWGTSGNRLFVHDRDHRFRDATDAAGVRDGGWGWGAAFFDPTNTGTYALVHASGMDAPVSESAAIFAPGPTRLFVGDQRGSFVDRGAEAGLTTGNGRGVAVFDADRDGQVDIVIAHPGGRVTLYRNVTASAGNWIRIRVRPSAGLADGVGAVVAVTAGGRITTVEVQSVSDFLGQSERIVHVGLGPLTTVDSISVTFPSIRGPSIPEPAIPEPVIVRNVAVNRLVTIDRSGKV